MHSSEHHVMPSSDTDVTPGLRPGSMHIAIFGPTRVTTPHGVLAGHQLGGAKPRQVLEILAVSAGRPVSKERLADLLWAGEPPRSYLGTLESYVCLLRRSLGLAGTRGAGVVTVPQGYALDPLVLHVDLTTFRARVRAAQSCGDHAACLAQLEEALALVGGDLLADELNAVWAVAEREEVRREVVVAENLAASCALALGEHDVALQHAEAALSRDRLAEAAWRTMMRALSATGRRSEALRAYFELRDHLVDELGADPSPETTEVYLDLLRRETPGGGAVSARDEVRMLVRLLHEAVLAVPDVDVGAARGDRSWWKLAADMSAAS